MSRSVLKVDTGLGWEEALLTSCPTVPWLEFNAKAQGGEGAEKNGVERCALASWR